MTTYTWNISAMDCAAAEDKLKNVIKTVHWQCSGVDGTHSASAYATCALPAPDKDFVAYSKITQEQVLEWIWANGVNKEAVQSSIESQIGLKKNPPVVQPALPWI